MKHKDRNSLARRVEELERELRELKARPAIVIHNHVAPLPADLAGHGLPWAPGLASPVFTPASAEVVCRSYTPRVN